MDKKALLKITTIVGTRPEIIRLSYTIKLLDNYMDQVFIHTGQNYNYELNEIFFEDLGIRKPDYLLEIDTSSVGNVYRETISEESFMLSLPAISVWQLMERPEAQDAGTIILSGFDSQVVLDSGEAVIR